MADAGRSRTSRAIGRVVSPGWRLLIAGLCLGSAPLAQAQAFVAIAPGVHAMVADLGDITPENQGIVGNAGFIVGTRGVLVVDAGVSYRFGERMAATIAATTAVPVQMVVLTDPIQEFHFGSAAFQDRGVPVLAHRDAAALIAERCETCLKRLKATLGDAAMAGSRVVVPDRLIDASTTVDLGDRVVDLLSFGRGAAPGNVAVFDRRSGVLFAGGLVSLGRIPRLRDGDLPQWLAALARIDELHARVLVPGHGPIGDPSQAQQTRDYLIALDDRVHALLAQGMGLAATLDAAGLPAFEAWALYPAWHRENVQELYLRLERAELQRKPA